MDIDDYNNEMARRAKKPVDKNSKTYIPFRKTFSAYAAKKLPYSMPPDDNRITNFVHGCPNEEYARKVTRVYKVKSPGNENKIFVMWNETRYGRTGIGNAMALNVDNVGQYHEPIPDYTIAFDQRTEAQQIKIKGVKEVVIRYNLEYSDKIIEELLKDAEGGSPDAVQFVLKVDTKQEDMIVSYPEFMSPDFDAVYNHHRDLMTARKTGVNMAPPNLGLSGTSTTATTATKK